MTIKGMVFDEKKAAGERLMLACKEMPNADMMLLGTYRGFELNIRLTVSRMSIKSFSAAS